MVNLDLAALAEPWTRTDAALDVGRWAHAAPAQLAVITPLQFGPDGMPQEITDEATRAEDLLLRRLATEVLTQRARWLLPLMQAAVAVPVAAPGFLGYTLPHHHAGIIIPLPDLGQYMQLAPAVGDVAH